ncbi:MAG: type II secretion system protein GspG [Planctomycetes bacterium]|nr:type II secretion system protein GspG [Planctomycetota bacterium]MCP4838532.1 type II secretion system protein GspG [Planctomycetota bacterium]
MNNGPTHRRRRARRGFTTIEVIVIVTILALLMTVVATNVLKTLGKGQSKIAQAQAAKLHHALVDYLMDINQPLPEDNFDLTILTLRPEEGGGPGGPYLQKRTDIFDPWENPFFVIVPGEVNADFDVLSYGADGVPGGDQANEDVTQ